MTIKYAILNPLDGSYGYSDTLDGAADIAAGFAAEFYATHTQNAFITVVEETDGVEKWYAPTGEQVPSPAELKARAERYMRVREAFANAETLAVTKLGE